MKSRWCTQGVVVVVAFFVITILSLNVASAQLLEEDGDETFATDLKEAGLTIANVYEFHRKYGSLSVSPANMHPPWSKMDPSGEDDFLFSSDFGLSRHKRAVQNNSVPLYSGEDSPCDTNSSLCSDTGQVCVYSEDNVDGYVCLCEDTYEDQGGGVCVAIPESKKLYLTTTIQESYHTNYSVESSLVFKDFQNQSQEAFSMQFNGLEGYKTLAVLEFRNNGGNTQVVYSIFFMTDVEDATIISVALRVLAMEKDDIQIGDQQYPLVGNTGIFKALNETQTDNDAVDWCSDMRLYLCTDPDRQCLDVGVDPRFSCVCKKGYVEEDMVCVDEATVQLAMYPFGDNAGDKKMAPSDDGTEEIYIPTGIPMGSELPTSVFIGINGLLSFRRRKSGLSFQLDSSSKMFCPYLADINTLTPAASGSAVYHHLYKNRADNDTVFRMVDEHIQEFAQIPFDSKLVLVATWYKVPPYGSTQQDEQVTFQTALASNGTSTYAVVIYRKGSMNWKYKPGTPIIIGLAQGEGRRPKLNPMTNTPQAFDSLDKIKGNSQRRGMWLHELGQAYSPEQECEDWYQRNWPKKTEIYSFSSQLPFCPCSVFGLSRMWIPYRYFESTICYRLSFGRSFFFYPYSKECCYRFAGRGAGSLVEDPPNAGGLLAYNPIFYSLRAQHRKEDLDAHSVCCYKAAPKYCRLYYELRPVGICSNRASFRFSMMLGDPHVLTLDGLEYTFNGLGEYTMVNVHTDNVSFTLQGRTGKALNDNGTAINATVFTAFAASENGVRVTVELEPNNREYMIIYADDKDYTVQFSETEDMLVEERFYTLQRKNNSLDVTFPSAISLSITLGVKMLDVAVSMPNEFDGLPKGLLGNSNNNPADDFILPNGTMLDSNMTEREIFQHFGSAWLISDSESLFRYEPKKGPADFRFPDFVPIFLDEASGADKAEAEKLCGPDNVACIYDYIATGSKTVAEATSGTKKAADETESNIKNNAPEVNANDSVQAQLGQPVRIQLIGSDAEDGNSVTYFAAQTSTGNFTLDNSSGLVTYQVTPNQTDDLSFFVVDSKNTPSPVKAVVIVVCPMCNSPYGQCDPSRPRASLSSQTYTYASCNCTPWYDGDECEHDFDGCADDPCIPGQDCTDMPAAEHEKTGKAFNCSSCPTGYSVINGKCGDVDECNSTSDNRCGQKCENTEGSYQCSCMEGFRLSPDEVSCEDINECVEKTSNCEQICTNVDGGYNCSCEDGYTLNATDNSCVQQLDAVAKCQMLGCSQGCKVLNGSDPQCFCLAGYVVSAANDTQCEDVDECQSGICSQECDNSEGSFECSCYSGFKLDADGTTCVPCPSLYYGPGCSQLCDCNGRSTRCDPVTGCVCEDGWRGTSCEVDVDECRETPGICGSGLEECLNTNGSYRCQCLTGYSRNPVSSVCEDVDECSEDLDLNTCAELENCINTVGAFHCDCRLGYQRNGTSCMDSNECENGMASCQQICINNIGSFSCGCNLGFRLAADRKSCEKAEDVCAAALNCSFECTLDDKDQPYCFCKTGYFLGADHQTCFDINECEDQTVATCSHICTNKPGTFQCSCPVGMRLDNDQRNCYTCETGTYGTDCSEECGCGLGSDRCDPATGCQCKSGWTGDKCDLDIDECQTVAVAEECSQQNAQCDNYPGGYQCACAPGYEKNMNTSVCEDVNECSSSPCSQRCENSPGSFLCLCNAGFTLNATTSQCEDNDECTLTSTNRCTQECVNTVGSYRCTCNHGFSLDNNGYSCTANTECANASMCANATTHGGCFVNQTTGNDTCFCDSGFELAANNDCQLEQRDWCGEAGCAQKCDNITTPPYFNCSCNAGYQLNDDARTCRECPSGQWGMNCGQQCTCDVQKSVECVKDNGTCVCKTGWEGSNCTQDLDECQTPSQYPCVANSNCSNTDGSYICVCSKGFFKGADGNCTECAEGFYDDCSKSCECETLNTESCDKQTGACTCKMGWTGTHCSEDIDECNNSSNAHNCTGANEECRNKAGGFDCFCETGYQYEGLHTCVDRDECLDKSHNCSQSCRNTDGGFTCSCDVGYNGDVYNCTECPEWTYGQACANNCTCNMTGAESCDNVVGTCLCKPGWTGTECHSNVNECYSNPCPTHSNCSDTEGSYECTCNTGYTKQADGNCTACTNNTYGDSCASNCSCNMSHTQSCDHVNGTCYCVTEWEGDTCDTDVDECEKMTFQCDQQNTKCENNAGSYDCVCKAGFQLSNSSVCVDIDECRNSSLNTCNQTCSNTEGSFTCSCRPGYTVNGTECDDVDECSTENKGGCEQVCNNSAGSFSCSCNNGYVLSRDNNKTCAKIKSFAFGISVDIKIPNLANILNDTGSGDYQKLETEVKQKLFEEMKKTVLGLLEVIIQSMSVGSLVVDATAKVDPTVEEAALSVASAVVGLGSTEFTFSNQTGVVKSVTFNSKTVTDACDAFEAVSPCPTDTYCRVDSNSSRPSCLPVEKDVTDYKLIIGLGVGIPLFFIALISIACLVYIHIRAKRGRKRELWSRDNDQLSGVLSGKIATRAGPWGPVNRGFFSSPDSLSSASDDDDNHHRRMMKASARPEYDNSPWNNDIKGDGHTPSNFSWDFLYNQLPPPDQPFTIKRPQLSSSPNPTYDNPSGRDGDKDQLGSFGFR